MSDPLVTVLIPVFNAERYLRSAVKSVLAQTYHNLEIVVVDDGSTDNSPAILRELASIDPRIIIITKKNGGISSALNCGLAAASGAYVARMDADDLMCSHRVETQIRFLEVNLDLGFCASAMTMIDETDSDFDTYRPEPTSRSSLNSMLTRRELITYTHPTVTFRTETARILGGYRSECEPCEDTELFGRFITSGAPGLVIPEILLRYRVHDGSISRHKAIRQIEMSELTRINLYRRREGQSEYDPGNLAHVVHEMPMRKRFGYKLAIRARVLRQISRYDRASGRWIVSALRLGLASLLQPHKAITQAFHLIQSKSRLLSR